MELKQYNKQGIVSVWSNSKVHNELLACSSPNPYSDTLFDLEILSVDLADRSKNLNFVGKSSYNVPFRCLAWDTFGERDDSYSHGLIFGGMENGSFTIWNPQDIVGRNQSVSQDNVDDQPAFLYAEELQEDGSPILCAEWNSLKNNYLAFGSTNLLLMDVGRDVTSPDIMKPSQKNPHEGSYITSVTWNKEVPHILASAGSDGLIALWDIKTNKSIFNFKDSAPNTIYREVSIAWSKHISTQIAVTLDDERKNELQIWDLRNKKGPIIVIDREHTKGINSMDWSDLDHDLILTAGRDHKIVCWNYREDEEPLSSREIDSQILKVAWSRTLPSIYSVTTVDGLSICSLDDKNILSYVPKWMKVPVSATFNGNQSFLVHSEDRGHVLNEYTFKAPIKKNISARLEALQEFINTNSVEGLKQRDGENSDLWKVIGVKLNGEEDSQIYDFLDLNKEKITTEVEKYTGKKRDSSSISERKSKNKSKGNRVDYIPFSGTDAANFFGSMGEDTEQQNPHPHEDDFETESIKYDMVPRNYNWNIGKQRLIKQNMLIGNYEGAIDAALKCGRTAEALIIAFSIDPNTFNNTLKTFFTETTDNFISDILKHIAFKDNEELVRKYELEKWKECIALIFSLSTADKRKSLLNLLGSRLSEQSKEYSEAAVICFILAEKFDKIVEAYQKRLSEMKTNSSDRKSELLNLGTRLIAISDSLTVNAKPSIQFDKIIRQMGMVCLENNKKILAYTLFTKYIPQSSTKYIDYLIHNTPELADYRSAPTIVQLPIMAAKKVDKVTKKGQKPGKLNQEPPTNMKPGRGPPKPIPISEPQEAEAKPPIRPPKRGIPMPPTYEKEEVTSPKNNLPPPPPSKKQAIVPPHEPQKQTKPPGPPPPPAKKTVPPPPPVHKPSQKTSSYEEPQTNNAPVLPPPKRGLPPPPTHSSHVPPPPTSHVPPPPPPSRSTIVPPPQRVQEPEHHQVTKPGRTQKVPPPPKKEETKYYEQEDSEPQSQKQRIAPPPPKQGASKIPPPPVGVRQQPPPPATRQQPPPPGRQPPAQQHYQEQDDENSEDDEEESAPQTNFRKPPPRNTQHPPSRNAPQPRAQLPQPPSRVTKTETEHSYTQEQSDTSFQQAPRGRAPPPVPPGARKAPPPPGRR